MDPIPPAADGAEAIAHLIQLAVAPVLLIAGIGLLLNGLHLRLLRVVDRGRLFEDRMAAGPGPEERPYLVDQLRMIDVRLRLMNWSVTLCAIAVLVVCMVMVLLFTGAMLDLALVIPIGLLFIGAMLLLIVAMVCFVGEMAIAQRVLRVKPEYLRDPAGD